LAYGIKGGEIQVVDLAATTNVLWRTNVEPQVASLALSPDEKIVAASSGLAPLVLAVWNRRASLTLKAVRRLVVAANINAKANHQTKRLLGCPVEGGEARLVFSGACR
jgi:hypothetical protein